MNVLARFILLFVLLQQSYVTHANKNIEYLYIIYSAEDAIIDGEYSKALALYQKAFDTKGEKLFAIDIHNAAICAWALGDDSTVFQYLDSLSLRGVTVDYLNFFFAPIKEKYPSRYDLILTQAKDARAELLSRTEALRLRLDKLVEEDQYYHTLWSDYVSKTTDKTKLNAQDSFYKIMDSADERVSDELVKIYESGHTLSEFELGPFMQYYFLSSKLPFDIIILHSYQGFVSKQDKFTNIMKRLIENGAIHPYSFASAIGGGNSRDVNYGMSPIMHIHIENKLYYNKFFYEEKAFAEEIDKARSDVALYPLKSQLRRMAFSFKGKENKFIFNIPNVWGTDFVDTSTYKLYGE